MALQLPSNETEFMRSVRGLPYSKRHGYAIKLSQQYSDDPKLLALINELLSTTLLPTKVPYPKNVDSDPEEIDLQFPQTTASKRFTERELGLTMAISLGESALPIYLDALTHPSTAGRSKVVNPAVAFATDNVLFDLYNRCVPFVQHQLQESMTRAGRYGLLDRLGLKVPPPALSKEEPLVARLEKALKETTQEYKRDEVWRSFSLESIWPHHNLRNPKYIDKDSTVDLVDKIFELAEEYPPHRDHPYVSHYKLASPIEKRCLSFLKRDLRRTLALVGRFCRATHQGKEKLFMPGSFMSGKSNLRFWHQLSLEVQKSTVEPFLSQIMEGNNAAFLRDGQFQAARLLGELRWPVVHAITHKAMNYLKNATDANGERRHIINFILDALTILRNRLYSIASVDLDVKRRAQESIERGASDILVETVKRFLASLTQTETSDESIVKKLQSVLVNPALDIAERYQSLARVLLDGVQGVFSMSQVSLPLRGEVATRFLGALKPKSRTVFDIPNNGVLQPYSNLPAAHNDDIFQLIITLWPPKTNLSFYTQTVAKHLSSSQRDHVWSLLNDADYFIKLLYEASTENQALAALRLFPPSPAARHSVVTAAISHSESPNSPLVVQLYGLADISDNETRSSLQKLTYTRLFNDRFLVYRALIDATMATESVKEFITTMTFFIPRIRNEIAPDATSLPGLFSINRIVGLLKVASESEAPQIADLYLKWEKQNNEAVSPVSSIAFHIETLVNHCLSIFCGTPSHTLFQMGLDLLWIRCVNDYGLSKARSEFVTRSANNSSAPSRSEAEELEYRKFLMTIDKDVGNFGYWRIQDEVEYVQEMHQRNQQIYGQQSFQASAAYSSFMDAMLASLGVRWSKVPLMVEYMDAQMTTIRAAAGNADSPSDWRKSSVNSAVSYVIKVQNLYHHIEKCPPSWWKEFRTLRLLSTSAGEEVSLCLSECVDAKGLRDQQKLDSLVEQLLQVHPRTACYIPFVAKHLMLNRQDLLRDAYITEGSNGVFNQTSLVTERDDNSEDPIPPPSWEFTNASRFFPHQCEVFAAEFLRVIHSDEYPLQDRVRATEKFTKLPTTTILELATLLKEDVNPRISEAILMFLPRLDEPAAGIQFLLAPAMLRGDLARTAVHSVRRSLEHVPVDQVPTILEPVFTTNGKIRSLKVSVFKELVRVASEYIALPEMQALIKKLWNATLHQDVRIALMQSVLPMLRSPQQDFAWTIINDLVSRQSLLLDDTAFVLLSVTPEASNTTSDDLQYCYLETHEVLNDLATATIPKAHCTRFVDHVLWPLTKINVESAVSSPLDKKPKAELIERLDAIHREAYRVLFDRFLSPHNAAQFAEKAAREIPGLHGDYVAGNKGDTRVLNHNKSLLVYLITGIGRCVAREPSVWHHLLGTIDYLASVIAKMQNDVTVEGLRTIELLRSLQLSDNFLFDRPDYVRQRVTEDRMSLLEPFRTRGVWDILGTIGYLRRISLCKKNGQRVTAQQISDTDLSREIRSLVAETVKLSQKVQLDSAEVRRFLQDILSILPRSHMPALRAEILGGDHGIAEAPWANDMKLVTLQTTVECTATFSRQLNAFHTEIATQKPTFYQEHFSEIERMIRNVCDDALKPKSVLGSTEAFDLLIRPVLEREKDSNPRQTIINRLFKTYLGLFLRLAPEWTSTNVYAALLQAHVDTNKLEEAKNVILSLTLYLTKSRRDLASYPCCFLSEAIYSGELLSLDLSKLAYAEHKPMSALTFPYFVSDDPSGGDMEDRSTKANISGLQELYDAWKGRNASSLQRKNVQNTTTTYSSSSALKIVLSVYDIIPKLILTNPSLFLSCLCLSLSDPDLYQHSDKLISSLKNVLKPAREGDSGNKWGWLPPAELALSFSRKMLTELSDEVSEAVVEGDFAIGVVKSKIEGVSLLHWWTDTFFRGGSPLVDPMAILKAEGKDRLLQIYEELRLLAYRDAEPRVRAAAFELPRADELEINTN